MVLMLGSIMRLIRCLLFTLLVFNMSILNAGVNANGNLIAKAEYLPSGYITQSILNMQASSDVVLAPVVANQRTVIDGYRLVISNDVTTAVAMMVLFELQSEPMGNVIIPICATRISTSGNVGVMYDSGWIKSPANIIVTPVDQGIKLHVTANLVSTIVIALAYHYEKD